MNRSIAVKLLRGALGLALGCYVAVAAAQDVAPANQLQSIDVQKLGGKQVQLTLHLSGPAPEPLSFTIDKPARISLDTLRMVGTLKLGGQNYGLVQVKDGRVQRVLVGSHIGQNEGKITEITPSKITLTEIVPDGLGGYMERPASLALNE